MQIYRANEGRFKSKENGDVGEVQWPAEARGAGDGGVGLSE